MFCLMGEQSAFHPNGGSVPNIILGTSFGGVLFLFVALGELALCVFDKT